MHSNTYETERGIFEIRSDIIDILLEVGIPANIKGFTYIRDAMELFDTGHLLPTSKEPSAMPLKLPPQKEIVKW